MNDCEHKLSLVSEIILSQPFRQRCKLCGQVLYRKHPVFSTVIEGLFIAWGIPLALVLFLASAYFPWTILGLMLVLISTYIWDVINEPILEWTETDQEIETKYNIKILLSVLGVLLLGVIIGYEGI